MTLLREQCREALWPGNPPGAPNRRTQDAMLDRLMATLDRRPGAWLSQPDGLFAREIVGMDPSHEPSMQSDLDVS